MENQEKQSGHYLFGMHPVLEAIGAGRKFEKVLLKQGLEGSQFRQLMELLQENRIPWQFVPLERLNRLVRGAHQGVVAYISQIDYMEMEPLVDSLVAKYAVASLKAAEARSGEKIAAPLLVLVDGVSDVRNFGAIARTCECAGVNAVILPAKGGAAINADAIKTSAGALIRLPVCRVTNLKLACYYLLESGFQIVAATEKTDGLIYDVDFTRPTAIVMGAEDHGISPAILSLATACAKIPMMGAIGSLNVSVATSVVLYEAVRQRL